MMLILDADGGGRWNVGESRWCMGVRGRQSEEKLHQDRLSSTAKTLIREATGESGKVQRSFVEEVARRILSYSTEL